MTSGGSARPFFSVVIPVRDGGDAFERCLDGLAGSLFDDWELIVVDDGSGDGSAERARRRGAKVVATVGGSGPAAARNLGSGQAEGEFLFFLDADCVVHPDTLGRAADVLRREDAPDAVFGSYDDRPGAAGFVARFKNLLHHYVHQKARSDAETFWAGCGAVRRTVFRELGGFDAELFPRPSIEDIELGYRLRGRGHRIRLGREIQVKHLKRWTFWSLIRTDVRDRGVPWIRLMLERGALEGDLNLRWQHRISVVLAWLLTGLLFFAPFVPSLLGGAAATAALLLTLNHDLYRFLARREGMWFAVRAVPLHWFHHLYGGIAFVWGGLAHLRDRATGRGVARG